MRLKDLGKVSDANKVFNNLISGGATGNLTLAGALKDLDVQAKVAVVSQSALNEAQKMGVLATSGLTSEELKNAASTLATSAAQQQAAGSTGTLSLAFNGLAASLGISTTALAAFLGIAVALGAGVLIYPSGSRGHLQKNRKKNRHTRFLFLICPYNFIYIGMFSIISELCSSSINSSKFSKLFLV